MMGLTAVAKLFGLLRSARIAALLGVGWEADAFSVAKQVPSLLFDLFLAALPACLIPVYCREGTPKKGLARLVLLSVAIFGALSALLCVGTVGAWLRHLFPSMSQDAVNGTHALLPVFALSLPLMGLCSILTALCQCEKRYLRPALAGCLTGALSLIALYRLPFASSTQMAFLLFVTWLLQVLFLLPILRKSRSGMLRDGLSSFGEALRLFPASLLSSRLLPFSLACAMVIASRSVGGSARFDYAFTFFSAALGVLVSGVINYSFPRLATLSDETARKREIEKAFASLLQIALPLSLLLCFLSPHIIAFFYENGRFDGDDTQTVSRLLSVLALSLPFCALEEMLRRIGLLSGKRSAAYLPPVLGGVTALILSLPVLNLRNASLAFLAIHGIASLVGCHLLRGEIGRRPLRLLPPMLMGCAAICAVYTAAGRLLPPALRLPIPFSLTVVLCGVPVYLTVCRAAFGRERRPSLL